jgi:hypothetical protein
MQLPAHCELQCQQLPGSILEMKTSHHAQKIRRWQCHCTTVQDNLSNDYYARRARGMCAAPVSTVTTSYVARNLLLLHGKHPMEHTAVN